MATTEYGFEGLTDNQVKEARLQFGRNEVLKKESGFFSRLLDLLKEPMLVLLLVAALLYFISGEYGNGIFMLSAIVLVSGISFYQESRSKNALATLRNLTQPTCHVIRGGKRIEIMREEMVVGDFMIVEEGTSIPADGLLLQSNDFSVNESILTGESLPVNKSKSAEGTQVFQGTAVVGGLAICQVTAVGEGTALGKIGKSIEAIAEEETPLQLQINNFVKKMALAGIIIFFIVWGINFFNTWNVLGSLLQALTLAMSILPEEIPVAFATFMALGSWRLMKLGIIVKQTKTVETLGSATVICIDKTGTITENSMRLVYVYAYANKQIIATEKAREEEKKLIEFAMWASEPIAFDPMEKALHNAYSTTTTIDKRPGYTLVHEYPLSGKPPMMTHVFETAGGDRIISAKGAPEAIIAVCKLSTKDEKEVLESFRNLAKEGFRVLAVATAEFSGNNYPTEQQQLPFSFKGLVAFHDPPKKNITTVFDTFYKAGIEVKIITGDNAATTSSIANQIHFKGADKTMSGDELISLSDTEIQEKVKEVNIFTRMFPEAKLKILNALKANGQIVAMTGDGVNDGPALKAAHISIAMGKKGSELAKEVSSIILTDDDLAKMTEAVAMGRRIYTNLKKAIQYIISIHIPIILTVLIPLLLGWIYPSIFSPVHVIFLELIMGPTCSIIYENEPMEQNLMNQKPRLVTASFFTWKELSMSMLQGLVIAVGILFIYQYAVQQAYPESITRTMVFLTLITANIFLTLVNRSFYYSIFTTLRYKNNLIGWMIALTLLLTASLLFIPPFARFFEFEKISFVQLGISILVGTVSVIWFEGFKFFKRMVP